MPFTLKDGKVVETIENEIDINTLVLQKQSQERIIAEAQVRLDEINAKISALEGLGISAEAQNAVEE